MIPEIVSELILNVNISNQQATRIRKVYEEEYYVLDHSVEESKINIFISGSSKSVYTITVFKGKTQGSAMWCNCPDSKSHAARHNCICKHCCFVLLKIGRIYDANSIINKLLSVSQENQLTSRLLKVISIATRLTDVNVNEDEDEDKELTNQTLKLKYMSLTSSSSTEVDVVVPTEVKVEEKKCTKFDKSQRELEEDAECPICFDYLNEGEIKSCPDCHNYVHFACIEKWLQTKETCVLCRSSVWKTFKKDHINSVSNREEKKKNNYLQL